MNSQEQEELREVIPGEPPSATELLYVEWAQEQLKGRLALLNDVLRQLLTLNATLLAGSLVFLDPAKVGTSVAKAVACAFFLSLLVTFVGVLPIFGRVDLQAPEAITAYNRNTMRWRYGIIMLAAGIFMFGFVLALIGFVSTES